MKAHGARAALAAGCLIAVGACVGPAATPPSSSPSPSPSPSPSARLQVGSPVAVRPSLSATGSATASATPATGPSPTPSVTPAGSPEFPHADPELEAYLPEEVGDTSLIRFSVPGSRFDGPGGDMCLFLCGNEPGDFARSLGVPVDAITIAFAIPEGDGIAIGAVAFRAAGAKPEKLIDAGAALHGVVGGDGDPGFPVRIAGRPAYFVDRFGRPQYLVPDGDVLVFLFGEPPTTAPNVISPKGSIPPDVEALVRAMP